MQEVREMRLQPDEMKCKQCQHSEFDPGTAPVLWCAKHGAAAEKPCDSFAREPGTEGDE
jgi:hypothetical protein